jgi:hypothetical protein
MVAGGLVAAFAIPRLDLAVSGSATTPTILSFAGMAVVTILLTGLVLRAAARAGLGLSQRWLSLALVYNGLIVAVKFLLAPWALYVANQQTQFASQGFGDANSLPYYVVVAVVIGVLYIAVFAALKFLVASRSRHISRTGLKNIGLGVALIILLGMFTGGSLVILPLFVGINALSYIGYIFSTPLVYALVAALVAAAVVAAMALRQSVRDELASGQTLSTASFFTLGITLITIYHFLWIVYMLSLVSLWPFKTYTPK